MVVVSIPLALVDTGPVDCGILGPCYLLVAIIHRFSHVLLYLSECLVRGYYL